MFRILLSIFGSAFIILGSASTSARLIKLDAVNPSVASISNFSVVFNDTGNGLFELEELVSFSGMLCSPCGVGGVLTGVYDTILSVPDITSVAIHGGSLPSGQILTASKWYFSRANQDTIDLFGSRWDYNVEVITASPAPIPSTIYLLCLAVLALNVPLRVRA